MLWVVKQFSHLGESDLRLSVGNKMEQHLLQPTVEMALDAMKVKKAGINLLKQLVDDHSKRVQKWQNRLTCLNTIKNAVQGKRVLEVR